MNAVAALSILFECEPGSLFALDHLRAQLGDAIDPIVRSGLLTQAAPARRVTCFDCDEAHEVSVEWDEGRQCLRQFCADGGGWAEVQPDALRRYSFDHAGFLTTLAGPLGLKGPFEPLVKGACWQLGLPTIANSQVAVVAARGMNDPRYVLEIAGALLRLKKWDGLIVCGARPLVDLGLLPKGLKTAMLSDLIALDVQGVVTIDFDAVEMALGLKRRARGEHGSTSTHPNLLPFIDERIRTGTNSISPMEEADEVLADVSWVRQGHPRPRRKSLASLIARRRKRLATK